MLHYVRSISMNRRTTVLSPYYRKLSSTLISRPKSLIRNDIDQISIIVHRRLSNATNEQENSNEFRKLLGKRRIIDNDNLDQQFQALSKEESSMTDSNTSNQDGYPDNDADLDMYEMMDGSDEPNPSHRLGKYLLRYSRVTYRHVSELPTWFKDKQSEITNYRSPQQIRRCLKSWMIETNQYERYKKYMTKDLIWRNDDVASNNAANIRAYGPDETVAYAHYHMPSRYAVTKRIMNELKSYLPNFRPERVLDYGCGPGTAGAAILETWEEDNGMKKYFGVDMSQAMLDAAKIMLENRENLDVVFWNNISEVAKRVERTQDRFDLAFLTYTLSELTTDTAKRAAVQVAFEMLDVGGCLVIIESGNPMGSHVVRTARQFVLDNFNPGAMSGDTPKSNSKRNSRNASDKSQLEKQLSLILPFKMFSRSELGARTVAPCTHDKPCPLSKGFFCSFSQKAVGGMIRKGSEEKYSYVVIQKVLVNDELSKDNWTKSLHTHNETKTGANKNNSIEQAAQSENNDQSPREILMRFQKCQEYSEAEVLMDKLLDEIDWDEYNPLMQRNEWSRVIRSPMKAKGHITIDVCSPHGKIVRSILSRGNVMNIPSLFVAIRKTSWGGLFPADIADSENDIRKSALTYMHLKDNRIEDGHRFTRPPTAKGSSKEGVKAIPEENINASHENEEAVSSRRSNPVLKSLENMKQKRKEVSAPAAVAPAKPLTGIMKTLANVRRKRTGDS